MILDVPTSKHIDDLISAFADSSFYSKFRSASNAHKQDNSVYAIFHLCGEGVLEDPRYKDFMNGFSSDTHVSPPYYTTFCAASKRSNQFIAYRILKGTCTRSSHIHECRVYPN